MLALTQLYAWLTFCNRFQLFKQTLLLSFSGFFSGFKVWCSDKKSKALSMEFRAFSIDDVRASGFFSCSSVKPEINERFKRGEYQKVNNQEKR